MDTFREKFLDLIAENQDLPKSRTYYIAEDLVDFNKIKIGIAPDNSPSILISADVEDVSIENISSLNALTAKFGIDCKISKGR